MYRLLLNRKLFDDRTCYNLKAWNHFKNRNQLVSEAPTLDFAHGSVLSLTLTFAAWFFFFFCYQGMGITLGYHRLLTHKSFKVPAWLRYLLVSGGYLNLMGGPVNWVGVHRLHHQTSDTEGDPHSPVFGFRHSLYEWMFTMDARQTQAELHKQVPDLLQDKILCWFGIDHCIEQAHLCLAFNILYRCLILLLFGYVALIANLIASVIVFWSPQLVNAVCHVDRFGYRLFDTRDESRNVWFIALLSHGEGWHNNHHAIPRSARHGMMWWEFDPSYVMICIMEKLGLATEVVRPTDAAMRQKRSQDQPTREDALVGVAD